MPKVAVDKVRFTPQASSTCLLFAVLRLTVKVMSFEPLSPSATLGELMVTFDVSSSVIVPVPVPVPIRAPLRKETPLNCATTVSSGSSRVSPCTATVTVLLV